MTKTVKSKNVLLNSDFSELGLCFIELLLAGGVKSLTVINNNADGFAEVETSLGADKRMSFIRADSTKITDLEEAFKEAVGKHKTIDIIINSKEITSGRDLEEELTIHINGLITGTLMAIKHLGKMNGGRGATVINSLLGESSSSVDRLLADLDRSFGDPYYISSTAVRILTMRADMVIPDPAGATSGNARWAPVGQRLLEVLRDARSDLRGGTEEPVEQFEISIEEGD